LGATFSLVDLGLTIWCITIDGKSITFCFLGMYENNALSLSKSDMLENTTFLCVHMNDGEIYQSDNLYECFASLFSIYTWNEQHPLNVSSFYCRKQCFIQLKRNSSKTP
jgi:hypothetical protein